MTLTQGWTEVFESGLTEVSDVRRFGWPSPHQTAAQRFRGLARRPDVWLPDIDDLHAAWDLLHAPAERGVVHALRTDDTGSAA